MHSITIQATCTANAIRSIASLPHETRAAIHLHDENGNEYAVVEVKPTTDTTRAIFPLHRNGMRGDTHRRGQSGVLTGTGETDRIGIVISRASRMYRS